jgi:DNA gyrase/topoisomerase IV subunit A
MALSSTIMQGAGVVTSAYGAYSSAKGQRQALRLDAEMADLNAELADEQARSALYQGEKEEQSSRLQTARLKSTQRAAYAANGVDLTQGSPANVLTSTDYIGEIDANTIQANAVRAAWGNRAEATSLRSKANTARSTASAISPFTAGATSLLGGAASVASSWYKSTKTGALQESLDATKKRWGIDGGVGSRSGWRTGDFPAFNYG